MHDEAAVVARTVLGTCHEARCARLGGGEHAVPDVVGLLSAGPRPFLVPGDPEAFFPTGAALRVSVQIPDVGAVECTATTEAARFAAEDAGVTRTLQDHASCIQGPVDPAALVVVPLQVLAVSVTLPGGPPPREVTPRALATARPDWLLARGPRLRRHLEQDHAEDLLRLAEVHGVPGTAAVSLAGLTTRGARLVCLGSEGVTTVEMVFDPPVRDPSELWRRMASAPARG